MRLDAITLEHFRNYAHQSVTFDPSVNVIVGENAQGKTNLLEAAVYLSCAKSPRARTEKEMISFEADAARLTGSVFSRGRDFTVEIELSRGKRRKMSVNQVPCKRAGDLSGVLNTVYFCPDDLLLIRDGAAARRRFMDLSLSQLRPRYDAALSEYNRLYDHKTRILRDAEEHPRCSTRSPISTSAWRSAARCSSITAPASVSSSRTMPRAPTANAPAGGRS
ncbi:MAG: DNA replication/repair protein RecF [Oscillospiraceae bacterium]